MRGCLQFGQMNVLEHGIAVEHAFDTLLMHLEQGSSPEGWRLPEWLLPNAACFLTRLLPREQLRLYQRYHDCGKPHCRTVDAEGRQHFPDHAEVSARTWLSHGGGEAIARLLALDMAFHTCSAEELSGLAALPEAASLYLTALAEVHANAQMFGGLESTSFKSKVKHLDRRGRALLRLWGT